MQRAMGTYTADPGPNLEYPMAFQEQFVKLMTPRTDKNKFRFVFLSGKFVEQDQNKSLWFYWDARKVKVCIESSVHPL